MLSFLKALFLSFLQLGGLTICLILLVPILVFVLVIKLRRQREN
ncbi:hypothetical protein JOC85_001015 [Bacillus mesophilus]|nr:hypothetical protein [Bacillus mesophilus]MBM7660248.1 hypothetical protein [Bacillus mesophilus]